MEEPFSALSADDLTYLEDLEVLDATTAAEDSDPPEFDLWVAILADRIN